MNCNNYRRGGTFNGNAVDFLKIRHKLFADPGISRSAICWKENETKPLYGPLHSHHTLSIGGHTYHVDRVNQPRDDAEAVIYTPAFGSSTRTRNRGYEVVVSRNRIIDVLVDKGNAHIPQKGFVYSIGKDCPLERRLKKGMHVSYQHSITLKQNKQDINISSMDFTASGAGLLIRNNSCLHDFEEDFQLDKPITHCADEIGADFSHATERKWLIFEDHPRSAVGILPDGKWLFVVVDRRQPGYSSGLALPQLADFMLEQGCTYALNMGGGGCSTLYVQRKIMNSPCGTTSHEKLITQKEKERHERPVCAAFVII